MRFLLLAMTLATVGCAHTQKGLAFADLHYPVPTKTLDVEGVPVAYYDSERGERTLLLIHGLGSYLPAWTRNVDALSAKYRVVAIDLPGYGKSGKANYQYSMEFFARTVDKVIEKLALKKVTLVGHSMGGQIALTHALLFPGRIDSLVLVAPAGFEKFKPGEASWLANVVTKDGVKLTSPEQVYANLAGNFRNMPREARFMADDRIKVIGGADFDAYCYAVSRSVTAMVEGPVRERLSQIARPVLVIFGDSDQLIPNPALHGGTTESVAREGVSALPQARLEMIRNAGHFVQFEKPDEFNALVLDFIARRSQQ